MASSSSGKPAVLVGVLTSIAVTGAVAYIFYASAAPVQQPPTQTSVVAQAPPEPGPRAAVPSTPDPAPPAMPAPKPAAGQSSTGQTMARDLERAQIWSALKRKHELEAPPSEAEGEGAEPPPHTLSIEGLPELDPEYVRSAIREQLVPVAVDCYNSVLQDDSTASGELILEFRIVGAEDVGGVVESSEIGEDSTFDSPFLRECLRESMMTVTFDPPPGDGAIDVRYPLKFEAGEDE